MVVGTANFLGDEDKGENLPAGDLTHLESHATMAWRRHGDASRYGSAEDKRP